MLAQILETAKKKKKCSKRKLGSTEGIKSLQILNMDVNIKAYVHSFLLLLSLKLMTLKQILYNYILGFISYIHVIYIKIKQEEEMELYQCQVFIF